MYVKIGNHPTTWIRSKLFDKYMKNKYGLDWCNVREEDYKKIDLFIEWLDNTLQTVYDNTINVVLQRRSQKIYVRVDDYDIWNADLTLAKVIYPVLCKLREETEHTITSVDIEDVPVHLRTNDTDQEKIDRWNWVLDEMIYAFDMSRCLGDEVDDYYDHEKMKFEHDRIKNGLRLFGKYYQSLWT